MVPILLSDMIGFTIDLTIHRQTGKTDDRWFLDVASFQAGGTFFILSSQNDITVDHN